MKTDVWKTLYGDNFDTEKYLYHYTSIDNAINIIHSDSLLFSQISKTNDTSEAKMKLIFSTDRIDNEKEYREKTELITKYFSDSNSVVQLLCFSMDIKLKASAPPQNQNKTKYSNNPIGTIITHNMIWIIFCFIRYTLF